MKPRANKLAQSLPTNGFQHEKRSAERPELSGATFHPLQDQLSHFGQIFEPIFSFLPRKTLYSQDCRHRTAYSGLKESICLQISLELNYSHLQSCIQTLATVQYVALLVAKSTQPQIFLVRASPTSSDDGPLYVKYDIGFSLLLYTVCKSSATSCLKSKGVVEQQCH